MCELFGITSKNKIRAEEYLRRFFKHSSVQPDGWGLAFLDDGNISVEKEPVKASESAYLKSRLSGKIYTGRMIAHIRKATMGEVSFDNTHPFYGRDESGRPWVLVHNGTIFDAPGISAYQYNQSGSTDSERILLYIIDMVNRKFLCDLNSFDVNERLELIDDIILRLVPGNKLNLLLYDGEYFYVHKNEAGTLFMLEKPGNVIFSTKILDQEDWKEVPQNQLLVYKDGELIFTGTKHEHTYVFDEEHMKMLYLAFAGL